MIRPPPCQSCQWPASGGEPRRGRRTGIAWANRMLLTDHPWMTEIAALIEPAEP
jgi:hypothetical protein